MKSKNNRNIIFPLLITIVIGVILILGIIWINKHYLNEKYIENFSAAEGEQLGNRISTGAMAQMTAAGIDTSNIDKQLESAFNQFSELITNEKQVLSEDILYTDTMDTSGSIINTTTTEYVDKTFFEGSRFSDGFCQTYSSNPIDLNRKCARLTGENCNATDCCILLNGSKCVAGNANGPLYLVDSDNNDVDYSYYSHKNECYGTCGKGIEKSANPCSAFKDTEANVSKECLNRLWTQTGCPNNYITDAKQKELKDYSKVAIKNMFKEATLENNYDKCYGAEVGGPNPWPAPCAGTENSTFNLSARCMTKLYNDAGCTNNSMINDVYVVDNKLNPKSAMINKFAEIKNGKDLDSYTKCYGRDELAWPNPCEGVAETASFDKGEVPYLCARKVWRDITKCPNSDIIKKLLYGTKEDLKSTMGNNNTLADYRIMIQTAEDNPQNPISNSRSLCFGINPNNWPDVESKMNDPCLNLNYDTKWGDLMPDCQKRILDLYDSRNEIKKKIIAGVTKYSNSLAWQVINHLEWV